ncbi:unnamed protein product [Pneumocystis jirovecii]|uniref:Uncharacterized protein n=1 Tax=Pneumocystis jirovecii TaxID=42068 RepID=L0PAX6_PNEJI|nr:unnamed protein product [Pneumocystis jirovecii]
MVSVSGAISPLCVEPLIQLRDTSLMGSWMRDGARIRAMEPWIWVSEDAECPAADAEASGAENVSAVPFGEQIVRLGGACMGSGGLCADRAVGGGAACGLEHSAALYRQYTPALRRFK